MKIKLRFNYEISQQFCVRGWCKYCGTEFDECNFHTLEELARYLACAPFICGRCEEKLQNREEK